ncbi:MAG: hypothetical protein NTW41_01405 [Verrucomicrobia bacterium]|jgi:hypothetical protein|nr:hypothetical protein [Verrucomicrobiota bacterium]
MKRRYAFETWVMTEHMPLVGYRFGAKHELLGMAIIDCCAI